MNKIQTINTNKNLGWQNKVENLRSNIGKNCKKKIPQKRRNQILFRKKCSKFTEEKDQNIELPSNI